MKKQDIKEVIIKHAFDFFILFLAISLGFFVDNYRDKCEIKKATQEIVEDILIDMDEDSSSIYRMMVFAEKKHAKLDSLYLLVDDGITVYNDSLIYYYSANLNELAMFERHRSSYTVLMTTGHLSDLSRESSKALAAYEMESDRIEKLFDQERNILSDKIYPFQQLIFHTENFSNIRKQEAMKVAPIMKNWNEENQLKYHNYVTELRLLNEEIILHYEKMIQNLNRTEKQLNKDYN